MGNGHWAMGKGERGKGKELLPMPHALCPLPDAPLPITHLAKWLVCRWGAISRVWDRELGLLR
jgi:hypothetical protein